MPFIGLLYQPWMIVEQSVEWVNDSWNRSTSRKPVPVSSATDPILLDPGSNRAAAVESQHLTAWAMARPLSQLTLRWTVFPGKSIFPRRGEEFVLLRNTNPHYRVH
jgi:hypothetical protein